MMRIIRAALLVIALVILLYSFGSGKVAADISGLSSEIWFAVIITVVGVGLGLLLGKYINQKAAAKYKGKSRRRR